MATPPFKVKAIYDYKSPHEDDLGFLIGQIITVTEVEDDDWFVGEYTDASGVKKDGLFPRTFVENYEPEPPPRPVRGARSKQPETTRDVQSKVEEDAAGQEKQKSDQVFVNKGDQHQPEPAQIEPDYSKSDEGQRAGYKAEEQEPAPAEPPPAPKPAPAVPATTKGPPPAVAEKPSSFRDKIAAFNKPAAAPVTPYKPSNTPSGFIKKPFVAPPPSRNAYIPPARETPSSKPSIREDYPEASRTALDEPTKSESTETAGAAPSAEQEEETPKSTSLKDRIALLQKQQLEQAARRAEHGQKEKPKKPAKKLTGSSERSGGTTDDVAEPEKDQTTEHTELLPKVESPSAQDPISRPLELRRADSHDRDILSEGYNADNSGGGETTEDAEGNFTEVEDEGKATLPTTISAKPVKDDGDSTEDEEEELDPETKRRMELRERMAKMSGGMGMPGMFNPFGGAPMSGTSKKKPAEKPTEKIENVPAAHAPEMPRVPMFPILGMQRKVPADDEPETASAANESEMLVTESAVQKKSDDLMVEDKLPIEEKDEGDYEENQETPVPYSPQTTRSPPAVPSIPSRRPVPEEQPISDNQAPILSPSAGSESDDELSLNAKSSLQADQASTSQETHPRDAPPPVPLETYSSSSPTQQPEPDSLISQNLDSKQNRKSRVPPIPGSGTVSDSKPPMHNRRAPPPPPPPQEPSSPAAAPSSRPSTSGALPGSPVMGRTTEKVNEQSYYSRSNPPSGMAESKGSGEFDRYIDNAFNNQSTVSPSSQYRPPSSHRAAPPPIPGQIGKRSVEMARGPPPLPPSAPSVAAPPLPSDSHPYNASSQQQSKRETYLPKVQLPTQDFDEDELYTSSPVRKSGDRPSLTPHGSSHNVRQVPDSPKLTQGRSPTIPPTSHAGVGQIPLRPSHDFARSQSGVGRKSMDHSRATNEQEYIADDVDLSPSSNWWTQPRGLPPVFRERRDIICEFEGPKPITGEGKSYSSTDIYILYRDYSQTIISIRYDSRNLNDLSLEQRHEPPPPKLRQDQLEEAHGMFGQRIAEAVVAKQNTVVGDGSPQSLVLDLLTSFPLALLPVGTRAYGALVYANIGNATVQQYDEIRAGDIVTLRNAKLQGKHGPMHQKYSIEVGKPDHVGVVVDWDGTKKKVRAWEQGRESKKVKIESYKVGDLKSGEVRVWRVMSRSWVGWDSGS